MSQYAGDLSSKLMGAKSPEEREKIMSQEFKMKRPTLPKVTTPTCNCITTPCSCGTQEQTQERQRLQGDKKMSNTTKWAILIGGTLVLYYLIFKVSEGK